MRVSFLGGIYHREGLPADGSSQGLCCDLLAGPGNTEAAAALLRVCQLLSAVYPSFSSIASLLSALTSPKIPFCRSDEAQGSFDTIKTRFTTAPILQIPEPERQFLVEVDPSGVGVGAVLSQHSSFDQKIHPCALFYRRLTPSEKIISLATGSFWR